jgi:hypothetical protein
MKRFLVASLALSMIAVAAVRTHADDDDDGWISMFDGKSLDGWKINEKPESWKIEDGVIVANGDRSHLFFMRHDRPFVNFEFQAEVMTEKGSNSGIFFHTKFQEDGWPRIGYESQVNNTQGDPQKTGGLYNTVKVLEAPAKDGVWFTQYIKVDGNHVVVKIDGETVVDYTEPDDVGGTVRLGEGTFALQAHDPGSTVRYRNLKVRRLP